MTPGAFIFMKGMEKTSIQTGAAGTGVGEGGVSAALGGGKGCKGGVTGVGDIAVGATAKRCNIIIAVNSEIVITAGAGGRKLLSFRKTLRFTARLPLTQVRRVPGGGKRKT